MKLNRSESQQKKLYIGFFPGKCVAINPTKEELAELIGYELKDDADDIKYEGKDEKSGLDFVSLSFWLKSEGPEPKFFNERFRLIDKKMVSEKTGKIQFVSSTANATWVDSEANLPDWFTKFQEGEKNAKTNIADKVVREAIQGEANLYTFLRAWLSKVEWFDYKKMIKNGDDPTDCLIDTMRLFRNVDAYVEDEYRWLVKQQAQYDLETDRDAKAEKAKGLLTGPVVALATVYSTEKDGELKMYQNLYSEFWGSYMLKNINLAITTGNWQGEKVKKLHEQITGEHGIKDAYELCQLKEFNADEYQQTSHEVFKAAEQQAEDTSY